MEIWFNPGCSNCRAAKAALDEVGLSYTTRRYLDDPALIQRPIMVTTDGQAWVARDPDTVEAAIKHEPA